MIAKQRRQRDAVSISVADSAKRSLNSLYTTDVFTYTDRTLVEWFRKDNFERHQEARSAVPFFSTSSLAELMLKDKPRFSRDMESCQASIVKTESETADHCDDKFNIWLALKEYGLSHFAGENRVVVVHKSCPFTQSSSFCFWPPSSSYAGQNLRIAFFRVNWLWTILS